MKTPKHLPPRTNPLAWHLAHTLADGEDSPRWRCPVAEVRVFYESVTSTLTYVVFDASTRDAVVIDPVLDFDPIAVRTEVHSARAIVAFVRENNLTVHWLLETHPHADHLSASQILRDALGARVAIGARITEVQEVFRAILDLGDTLTPDGGQFDRLLVDGEILQAGNLAVEILATPGHTPACVTYKVDDMVFTGDTLFVEDQGTGRCDFPRGSANELYASVHDRLYALPGDTRVFVGHDYQPEGRAMRYETTIARSREGNVQLRHSTSREDFVAFRKARDATLQPPQLLFQSVQVNLNAGRLPPPHANGRRYLTLPMNVFHPVSDLGLPALP